VTVPASVADPATTPSVGHPTDAATRPGVHGATATTHDQPDVTLIGVTKRFGPVVAVDRMNLEIPSGSFTSLLGPSGCGKTTTLRMIAGFEQPSEGEILLAGRPIAGVPPYHRNVNTVFQHYALFPHMNVAQNVGYGLRQKKVGKTEETRRVDEALGLVRLTGYGKRRTWELSGGQQQRVALARALVNRPTVLLLDEPLGALDLKLRKEMQLELKALQQEVGITFIYVTHDQEEALTMSDMIVVMRDGLVQQQGRPEVLYERPVNTFVANFIGVSNPLAATVESFDATTHLARVETDGGLKLIGTVTDPIAHPAAGDRVSVAIRPEHLRVEAAPNGGATTEPVGGWTRVTGRINQGTYLGDQTEYRVQTDQAGELVVRRQNQLGETTGQGLGPGEPVTVRWHEAANLVLAG
jgi:spermidine/putrescine transport system ATP-binding protein